MLREETIRAFKPDPSPLRVRAAGPQPAAQLLGEHRRVRRLFAMLDDVGAYAAGYAAGTRLLAQSWTRISEFLQQAGGPGDCGQPCLIQNLDEHVSVHEPGSPGWWRAVRAAAQACEEHYARLLAHGE
jgi:hypothetical protein